MAYLLLRTQRSGVALTALRHGQAIVASALVHLGLLLLVLGTRQFTSVSTLRES